MLRDLIDDFKDCPATMVLASLWVLLFALIVFNRLEARTLPSPATIVFGNLGDAHQFGDMTIGQLFDGEPWRALTCTFVHYSLLHIALNLLMFYQLGCMIESWYGSGPFLAIYVL